MTSESEKKANKNNDFDVERRSFRETANVFLSVHHREINFSGEVFGVISQYANAINEHLSTMEESGDAKQIATAHLYPRTWRSPTMFTSNKAANELLQERASGIMLRWKHLRDLVDHWTDDGETKLSDPALPRDAQNVVNALVTFEQHPELVAELIKAIEARPPLDVEPETEKAIYQSDLGVLRKMKRLGDEKQAIYSHLSEEFTRCMEEARKLHTLEKALGFVQTPPGMTL